MLQKIKKSASSKLNTNNKQRNLKIASPAKCNIQRSP